MIPKTFYHNDFFAALNYNYEKVYKSDAKKITLGFR
jgi:hypothetical protein